MHIVLISEHDDPQHWRDALQPLLPGLTLHSAAEVDDPDTVSAALVWKPPAGALARFPRLRLVQNLGMGVDALFADGVLPEHGAVEIARLVDDDLIAQMSEYVCWAVLQHHRRVAEYARQQRAAAWRPLPATDSGACRVGVLGLGRIGADCAGKLAALGFPVCGWSRSPKRLADDGVQCFHGADGLLDCVAASRVLVCLLPLTADTAGIINARLLDRLPRGALLINVARGAHVVDDDLLAALDDGRLGGAVLDVFNEEPLPASSRYWSHPNVFVTPHVAGLTRPETAARQVAENLRRVAAGETPLNRVDPGRGY